MEGKVRKYYLVSYHTSPDMPAWHMMCSGRINNLTEIQLRDGRLMGMDLLFHFITEYRRLGPLSLILCEHQCCLL